MEREIVLAVLLRDWTMELIPGQNIQMKPAIPLGSNHPISRTGASAQGIYAYPIPSKLTGQDWRGKALSPAIRIIPAARSLRF
jgi:hypothetical protein